MIDLSIVSNQQNQKQLERLIFIIIGFLLGIIFTLLIANFGNTITKTAKLEIEKCEQTIPRNQHCTVVGIVKQEQ